jgi:methylmalonyl-CoA/ethylmalonyl-CoA epimerase
MSADARVPVLGLHHVGILVQDFDVLRTVFGGLLGCDVSAPDPQPHLGAEILWVTVNGVRLEFVRSVDPDSDAAKELAAGRGGVHHIAVEVSDVDAALSTLGEAGLALLDQVSRPGHDHHPIGFIDPSSVDGVLVELVAAGPARS